MSDIGYVVGVMLGDGSFGKVHGEDARVQMNTKDKEFAVRFAEALEEVTGEPIPMGTYKRGEGEWGTGLKHQVSKGMKGQIPWLKLLTQYSYIRAAPREFKLGVISGLFDSEGELGRNHGGRNPFIRFGVCDLELIGLWQDLCFELFGLHASINGPTHHTAPQYYIHYCGMTKCSRFFAEIPITIDRKRERWQQFLEGAIVNPYQAD